MVKNAMLWGDTYYAQSILWGGQSLKQFSRKAIIHYFFPLDDYIMRRERINQT